MIVQRQAEKGCVFSEYEEKAVGNKAYGARD